MLRLILSPSLLLLIVSLAASSCAFGQNDGVIHLPPTIRQGPDTENVPVRSQDQVDRERAQKANEMLQMEIKRDTEKLFQLSTELRDFVQRTNQVVLSVDAIKKAEQIEKLARGIKSKMKTSY